MDLALEELYKKETGAPFTDSLTGLFNHGFFQITLEREVKRSERHGEPFTLALIDIDSFALYNKRHGSVEGDRVLREIVNLIMKHIRQVDLAARYSGDVLAVILIKSNIPSALIAVERIRQAVKKLPDEAPTVSVGLASYPGDATNGETLIKKAQEALLQAKIKGKNRVCFLEKQTEPANDGAPKVLVVDDEPLNVKLLDALLRPLNYEVLKASNGEDALSIVKKVDLDLILLDIMKSHADEGCKICLPLMKNLGPALEVIRHHHEKLDGSGYPDGLKGDEISVAARVMGVVDIYDALITDRPYRKGMSKEKALEILHEEVEGGKLDKKVVEVLIKMLV